MSWTTKPLMICRNKILECMPGLWLVLVQNVPYCFIEHALLLSMMGLALCVKWCNISILKKECVCVVSLFVAVVSWAKLSQYNCFWEGALLLPYLTFLPSTYSSSFAPYTSSGNKLRRKRSLLLAYWTALFQKGVMSTRAGVMEDAGLSSGDTGKKDPLLLASPLLSSPVKRYLHVEASLNKKDLGWQILEI